MEENQRILIYQNWYYIFHPKLLYLHLNEVLSFKHKELKQSEQHIGPLDAYKKMKI